MKGSSERDRIEGLDVLRLFAALSVVLFHYSFRGAAADDLTRVSLPALVPVTKYGYLGVDLFFVISGFVIAWSAEGRHWLQFAVARFARIYPAFIFCMTATFLVTMLIARRASRRRSRNGWRTSSSSRRSPASPSWTAPIGRSSTSSSSTAGWRF